MKTPVSSLHCRPRHARVRGVSLIEVLVAIVVLSLGLLAMAGLQLSGLRASQGGLLRANAAQLASDMAERMRGNQGDARRYTLLYGATPSGCGTVCVNDMNEWLVRLRELPAGEGEIVQRGDVVVIRVRWDDTRAGGAAQEVYELETRVWG